MALSDYITYPKPKGTAKILNINPNGNRFDNLGKSYNNMQKEQPQKKDLTKVDIREFFETNGIDFQEDLERAASKFQAIMKRTPKAHVFVVNTAGVIIPKEALELIIQENIKDNNLTLIGK